MLREAGNLSFGSRAGGEKYVPCYVVVKPRSTIYCARDGRRAQDIDFGRKFLGLTYLMVDLRNREDPCSGRVSVRPALSRGSRPSWPPPARTRNSPAGGPSSPGR